MDRKQYCYELADMNERLWEIDNQLSNIKIEIALAKDPDKKQWYIDAQERLLNEKEELEDKVRNFMSEYSYLLDE